MKANTPLSALALALVALALQVPAQQPVIPGQPLIATLSPGQTMQFAVDSSAGDRVEIMVTSQSFTPRIFIQCPRGPTASSQGRRVQTTVTSPQGGQVLCTVQAVEPQGQGQFVIQANTVSSQSSSAGVSQIALGQTIRGTLAPGDRTMQTGELFDRHVFEGQAGQHVTITARSSAFDAYLILRTPRGSETENDDHGSSRDARISLTLPETGTYQIDVTSAVGSVGQGPYELVVE
ncbi:PPC domain-containing protein [Candidatus Sumerlaeota bacterium]|nr:PPC domain-containing protein [Candidatus Sumerlaeota bacterium]